MVTGYVGVKFEDWFWPLLAHCMIHGLAVAVITGSAGLGMAEVMCHFIIDGVKGCSNLSATTDQIMHLACKVWFWVVAAFWLAG